MMHKTLFYFIEKINIQEILRLKPNINIILRNYNEKFKITEIIKLKKICKQKRSKLFISNDYKIANQLRLDGYIYHLLIIKFLSIEQKI